MTQIPTPLLIVLVVLAAIGFFLVMLRFFQHSRPRDENPLTEIPTELMRPPSAPPGYKWILVPDDD